MIREGNEQGLNMIHSSYSDALYGIVYRILRKEEESEEVMQTVFLKVWNNIHTFDESKSTIFTWMASIARNAAIDMSRLKGFKHEKVTQSFSVSDYGLEYSPKQKGIDIEQLTKNMPDKYKMLVEKMFLEGYTQQEISDNFDIPLGTVKTRLREAINMLREHLKGERHLLYFLSLMV